MENTLQSETVQRPNAREVLRGFCNLIAGSYALGMSVYLLAKALFAGPPWWIRMIDNFAFWLFAFAPLALIFAAFARMRRATAFNAALVVAGLMWFGPRFLPRATAEPEGLRVITFNMLHHNPRHDDITEWLREADADIVFMQEVADQIVAGEWSGFDLYPYRAVQVTDLGLWKDMILSRYPILSAENLPIGMQGSTQQRVVVKIEGQDVALYNVHIAGPAINFRRIPMYDDMHRDAKIAALLAILAEETRPYIMAGDFNMTEFAPMYGKMAEVMCDSYVEAGVGIGASWPTAGTIIFFPEIMPALMRIDYVWHSEGFRAVDAEVGPRLGSDHLPIIAELELVN